MARIGGRHHSTHHRQMKSPANSPRPAPKGKKLGKVMWTNPADDGITSIRLYAIKSGADSCNEPSHTHPVLVFDLRDYPDAVERVARELARQESVSKHWRYFRRRAEAILQSALNWPAPTKGEGK